MSASSRDLKYLTRKHKEDAAKYRASSVRLRSATRGPSIRLVVVLLLLVPTVVFTWANWPGRVSVSSHHETLQSFEIPQAMAETAQSDTTPSVASASPVDEDREDKLPDHEIDGTNADSDHLLDSEPFVVDATDQRAIVEPETGELPPANIDAYIPSSDSAGTAGLTSQNQSGTANDNVLATSVTDVLPTHDDTNKVVAEPLAPAGPAQVVEFIPATAGVASVRPGQRSMDQVMDPSPSGSGVNSTADILPQDIDDAAERNWLSVNIKDGDNLWEIFKRVGINKVDAVILAQATNAKTLSRLIPGRTLKIKKDANGGVSELRYEIDYASDLHAERVKSGFDVSVINRDLDIQEHVASGTISSSLFLAGQAANIPDRLLLQLTTIFGWSIDFALDIREDDRFSLIYESKHWKGEHVRDGDIIAAEFINNGKTYRAIRLIQDGRAHYYTPEGESLRRAFLRSPMEFTRITSRFTKRRFHPILKRWKAHRGVDYGAPTGTSIRATADGKVHFRGKKGGYGNVVILSHGRKYKTLYAHLSRFARKTRNGNTIRQGDIIGYVGSTGYATGPHLHYEFRVNNKHVNPLTVKLPNSAPVPDKYASRFRKLTTTYSAALDDVESGTVVARRNTSAAQ